MGTEGSPVPNSTRVYDDDDPSWWHILLYRRIMTPTFVITKLI